MQVDPLEFQRLVPVRDRFLDDLLAIPGVTGVDVGPKEIDGEQQATHAILVFVQHKGEYRPEDEIPRTVAGVPTDVIEAAFDLHGSASPGAGPVPSVAGVDSKRYDPCQGGACIAPARIDDDYGSLGTLVTDAGSGDRLWLSAYHVLCVDASWNKKDRRVLQPAIDQGGNVSQDVIGEVVRGSYGRIDSETWGDPLYVDAAVCSISGRETSPDIILLGRPRGARAAVLNDIVAKYGATSQGTQGVVVSTDFAVRLRGIDFLHQYRVSAVNEGDPPLSMPGDSGSAVLDSGHHVIGIVMSGDGVRYSTINPIGQISQALGITVPTLLL
jgi:hypothetical protein